MSDLKSIEEKIKKLQEQQQKLKEQEKALKSKYSAEEREQHTKCLFEIGKIVESVLKRSLEENDLEKFQAFLNQQEQNENLFSKFMNNFYTFPSFEK